jgi:hypothetical protein
LTLFDSRSAFEAVAVIRNETLAQENFSALIPATPTANSFAGLVGTEAQWLATADGGLSANGSGLRSLLAGKAITISFASNQVFGVGANFFYVNTNGTPVTGTMILSLSDGTRYYRNVTGTASFTGIWSDAASITSLTVMPASATSGANFLGTNSMEIGYTPLPAPGAIALLALAGWASRRRA